MMSEQKIIKTKVGVWSRRSSWVTWRPRAGSWATIATASKGAVRDGRRGGAGWDVAAQAGSEEPRPEAEMRDLAEWTGGQMIAVSERPPRLHPGITQEVAPDESQRAPKATTW